MMTASGSWSCHEVTSSLQARSGGEAPKHSEGSTPEGCRVPLPSKPVHGHIFCGFLLLISNTDLFPFILSSFYWVITHGHYLYRAWGIFTDWPHLCNQHSDQETKPSDQETKPNQGWSRPPVSTCLNITGVSDLKALIILPCIYHFFIYKILI